MKNLNLLFASTILIATSCSHTPEIQESHRLVKFEDSKWMDQTDYVRYVNFFSRKPTSLGSTYNLIGDCGGFPMVDVKSAPGFCLGQISDGTGLKKPRTAAVINNTQVLIADQGSWEPYDGKIVALNFENGQSTTTALLTSKTFPANDPRREISNKPHQITRHTDGLYYVGSALLFCVLIHLPLMWPLVWKWLFKTFHKKDYILLNLLFSMMRATSISMSVRPRTFATKGAWEDFLEIEKQPVKKVKT